MVGAQEEEGAIVQHIAGGLVVVGFEVAGGDDPELLVCFVEVALGDPVHGGVSLESREMDMEMAGLLTSAFAGQ